MARKSILGTKLGMTQVFDENNKVVPVTVVKAGPNVVTMIRTPERDGYSAVQLAYGEISPRKVNKPLSGQDAPEEGKQAEVRAVPRRGCQSAPSYRRVPARRRDRGSRIRGRPGADRRDL